MRAIQILGPKPGRVTLNPAHPIPIPTPTPTPTTKDNNNNNNNTTTTNQLLIRVHAAGVTADELTWPELYSTPSRIPGHDISGVIVSASNSGDDDDDNLKTGTEVYGMLSPSLGAGQADYVLASAQEISRKPASLSHSEAAALPIPVLTAWQALFEHARLGMGNASDGGKTKKILVTGASGAVGMMVIQLARAVLGGGVEIVALASAEKREVLVRLGADEIVDYRLPDWEGSVVGGDKSGGGGEVDVVIDTVGGAVLEKSWKTVKGGAAADGGGGGGGVIITVADPPPVWADAKTIPKELEFKPGMCFSFLFLFLFLPLSLPALLFGDRVRTLAKVGKHVANDICCDIGVRYVYFVLKADSDVLAKAADLIDRGEIKALPVVEFPVSRAVEAWEFAAQRNRKGKVVIDFVSEGEA